MMKQLRKPADQMLIWVQSRAIYRQLGRSLKPDFITCEANQDDLNKAIRWLNPRSHVRAETPPLNPNTTSWVAKVDGQLVGFVQLVRFTPEQAPYQGHWLYSLNVKTRWRGMGIGEVLTQTVIDRAIQEGESTLYLSVYEHNHRATALYRKLGFEQIYLPELEDIFSSEYSTSGRRRVVMHKDLQDPGTQNRYVRNHTAEQTLPNAAVAELITAATGRGVSFRFRASGLSMFPFIRDGDVLTVAAAPQRLKKGQVAVFVNSKNEGLTVHRVVGRADDAAGYLMQGDNIADADGVIPSSQIIGHIIRVERRGKNAWAGLGFGRSAISLLSQRGWLIPLMSLVHRASHIFYQHRPSSD